MHKIFTVLLIFGSIFLAGMILVSYRQTAMESTVESNFNRDPQNYNAKLQIVADDGTALCEFKTAIADNNSKRAYGLMNLKTLPQDQAMLFVFDEEREVVMWMKNTVIALDMIFIDKNNVIVSIKTNTKPLSLDYIFSEKKVTNILEINAGLAEKFGIETGQKIVIKKADENF